MTDTVDTVTIPASEYAALKDASLWLECLENAGVDNWSGGYDYARVLYREARNEDEE